jgi:hypothetical protein
MSTTPELGFEYFPSPETSDGNENIAYAFLYCSVAVKRWPRARRRLIKAGLKSAEQCDHIEAHVISVFRETRDIMLLAIQTDNLGLMSKPRVVERLKHAHALLALFANPGSMPEYRDMVFPPGGGDSAGQPEQADFNIALWEAGWDTREGRMPAQVTREQAMGHRHSRAMDGLYNSHRGCDRVAKAGPLEEDVVHGPALPLEEQSASVEGELESLILKLRTIAKRAGLKPAHINFLVERALHGRKQKDNPTASRAIHRKRSVLYPEIRRLVASIRKLREDFILP